MGWCAGVRRLPGGIEATHVADSYAISVVAVAMGTFFIKGATWDNGAVSFDDIMVSYVLPAVALDVPSLNAGGGHGSIYPRPAAMDDNVVEVSHRSSSEFWFGI